MITVSPFAVVRCRPGSEYSVVIADPWRGRIWRGKAEQFANTTLNQAISVAETCIDPQGHEVGKQVLEAAKLWRNRGWGVSLDYYLWSRQVTYIDARNNGDAARQSLLNRFISAGNPPSLLRRNGRMFPLPALAEEHLPATADNLLRRRTQRVFEGGEESLTILANILAPGCKAVRAARVAAESRGGAGLLISLGVGLQLFVVCYSVAGLESGIYYYDIENNALIQTRVGNCRQAMCRILQSQSAPWSANWTIVLAVDLAQYQWRYRHERALRNVYIEVGRLAQRLIISAVANRIGTLPTPALKDTELSTLLGLHAERELPLYTLTMGRMPGEIRSTDAHRQITEELEST